MKKWQFATMAAMLALALLGAAGISMAGPRATAPIVVVPATVVVANPGWVPAGPAHPRPAALPAAPALPPAAGAVLFSADFRTADLSAWHSPLLPSSDLAPLWRIQDGTLQQAGDANGEYVADQTYYLTGQPSWTHVIFESGLLATSGADTGVVWNVQGDNFYRLRLFADLPTAAPKARLELVQRERPTLLAAAAADSYPGYTAYVWQSIRVQSEGDHQQVWVNGRLLFDVHNGALQSGGVGLYAWADSATRFANVRVQSAP